MRLPVALSLALAACASERAAPPPAAPEGMVYIPGGAVWVGSPRVGPYPPPGGGPSVRGRRTVWLDAYAIDVNEATRADYARFLLDTGYRLPSVGEPWASEGYAWSSAEEGSRVLPDHPVLLISWYDAREYCRWRGARLPTDAEWEVAALGAEGQNWPWGQAFDASALNHGSPDEPFFDDSDGWLKTSPVGAFPAGRSPYGLNDAFGNAWEWTSDAWGGSWDSFQGGRHGELLANPRDDAPALYHGARGGSYFFGFEVNLDGERNGFLSELRRKSTGVRCAVSLPAEPR